MSSRGITITSDLFQCIHSELKNKFLADNDVEEEELTVFQLYGFGNYTNTGPNIKNHIYQHTGSVINGKYLYNKIRQLKSDGKKIIQVRRDYFLILLKALGYQDRNDYLEHSTFVTPEVRSVEENAFSTTLEIDTQYYIGYYLDNNTQFIRTKFTIFDGKTVEWNILYKESETIQSYYNYRGKCVTNGESALSFYFSKENSNVQKECFINVFYGNNIQYKTLLLGCYCGFDRNVNPVVGKIVFERVSDAEEQERRIQEIDVIPNFYHYLFNQRLVVDGILPLRVDEIKHSPNFSSIIQSLIGEYHGYYLHKNGLLTPTIFHLKDLIGRASMKVNTSVFDGTLKSLNNDSLLSLVISNFEQNTYCNFSIQVNPVEPNLFLGFILSSIGMNLHCGRVLLWKDNAEIEKLIDSQEVFTLSNGRMKDIFSLKINEYLANKWDFKQEQATQKTPLPQSLYGKYDMKITLKNSVIKGILTLDKSFHFQSDDFSYKGKTSFVNGNINLQIEQFNDYPMTGMIIVFVGNITQSKIAKKTGAYIGLDEHNQPVNGNVELTFKEFLP